MKTDARVRYTRKVIQEAFLDILKDKPLSKITVKEICGKAEINRGTFYKHYQDIYDLLEKIEAEGLQEFEKMLSSIETTDAHAIIVAALNTLHSNQIIQLIQSSNILTEKQRFMQQLIQCCLYYMGQWLEPMLQNDCPAAKRDTGFVFLTGGSSNVIQWWIQQGMKESPEEIADYIIAFCEQITRSLLN